MHIFKNMMKYGRRQHFFFIIKNLWYLITVSVLSKICDIFLNYLRNLPFVFRTNRPLTFTEYVV